MKKKLILFLLLLLIPNKIIAKTFVVKDTDVRIDLGENKNWLIFTPDNLKGNKNLDKIKVKYKYIKAYLDRNDVYMVAVNKDIKMILSKEHTFNQTNLTEKEPREIHKYASKLTNNEYIIYTNDYKYILLNYKKEPYEIMTFYTIINNDQYKITFKKEKEFTEEDKIKIYKIINKIKYNLREEEINTIW